MKRVQENAIDGDVKLGRRVDKDRRLSAELEGDRREVLGGGAHDDAADLGVARVKDIVKPLCKDGRADLDAALNDSDDVVGKGRLDASANDGGHVRGHLGRLQKHRVAGRKSSHKLLLEGGSALALGRDIKSVCKKGAQGASEGGRDSSTGR